MDTPATPWFDDIVQEGTVTPEQAAKVEAAHARLVASGLIPSRPVPLPEAARVGIEAVATVVTATGGLTGAARSVERIMEVALDNAKAEGAAAERARIRQMALDFATNHDNGQPYDRTALLRAFAALLEKP